MNLARFRNEAAAAARLQHPNIVQIYEVGEQDCLPYLAMEFIEGGSLAGKIAEAPLPPRQVAAVALTLAQAIDAAHQSNIIHRDLKPANVLLTARGMPKISDFGLAKRIEQKSDLTRSGVILGTPSYMVPEQVRGSIRDISPVTDVYGLGATLYEMLTGRPPFRSFSVLDTIDQVLKQDPCRRAASTPRCRGAWTRSA